MEVKHFEEQIEVKKEKKDVWKKRFVIRMGKVIDSVFVARRLIKSFKDWNFPDSVCSSLWCRWFRG
jgi:hypothetical protein